jgi:hypothetical protein
VGFAKIETKCGGSFGGGEGGWVVAGEVAVGALVVVFG